MNIFSTTLWRDYPGIIPGLCRDCLVIIPSGSLVYVSSSSQQKTPHKKHMNNDLEPHLEPQREVGAQHRPSTSCCKKLGDLPCHLQSPKPPNLKTATPRCWKFRRENLKYPPLSWVSPLFYKAHPRIDTFQNIIGEGRSLHKSMQELEIGGCQSLFGV